MQEVRPFIWYEKDDNGTRTGRTFAISLVGSTLYLAASRCGPNDQFTKKIGRSIAEGRHKMLISAINPARNFIHMNRDSDEELGAVVPNYTTGERTAILKTLTELPSWIDQLLIKDQLRAVSSN